MGGMGMFISDRPFVVTRVTARARARSFSSADADGERWHCLS